MLEIFTYVGLDAVSEAKMQDPVLRVLEANPDTANMWLVDINDKLPKVYIYHIPLALLVYGQAFN